MMHDLVSAIVPTYNYGRFVCQAVESALRQTHPRMEVIVVDDGSTDDTRERLAAFGERIRYIYQHNRGLSAARNTGIRAANGDWVAFLDADDLWHSQKTEIQLRAARGVAGCGLIGGRPATELPGSLPPDPSTKRLTVREFLLSAPIGPSSALVRKNLFETCGVFDESLESVEDRDMWLRLAAHAPCVQVDSRCWWYRTHAAQMNRNAQRMFDNYKRVLDKFFAGFPGFSNLRGLGYSYLYFDAAWAFYLQGDRAKAVVYLLRSGLRYRSSLTGAAGDLDWRRTKALVRFMLGDTLFSRLQVAPRRFTYNRRSNGIARN